MQVPAVALQGCGALAVLTMEEQARASVREAGGAGALLRAMRLHPGEARLQQLGCTALASLAEMHVLGDSITAPKKEIPARLVSSQDRVHSPS